MGEHADPLTAKSKARREEMDDNDSNVSYSDEDDDNISLSSLAESDTDKNQEENAVTSSSNDDRLAQSNASSLMSLFSSPPQSPSKSSSRLETSNANDFLSNIVKPELHRQTTERLTNSRHSKVADNDDGISSSYSSYGNEMTSLLAGCDQQSSSYDTVAKSNEQSGRSVSSTSFFLPPIKDENSSSRNAQKKKGTSVFSQISLNMKQISSCIIGSIIFLLFHIVFSLAQAASIHRPYSHKPVLGVMLRQSSAGVIVAGSIFIHMLSGSYATVYPSLDCFPAPFFAAIAAAVDKKLVEDGLDHDDEIFLTTFGFLTALSLALTGILVLIGTKYKLVNMSAYLPYPVLCGFFSSVGILLWTLSFSIDTGENVWHVLFSGDTVKMLHCLKHHIGSIFTGVFIFSIAKRYRGLVPLLSIIPVPIVYTIMILTKTSLEDARREGWFWSQNDFKVEWSWNNVNSIHWEAPHPFGFLVGIVQGKLYLPAVVCALPPLASMVLIYLLRCTIHAVALRKNSNALSKWKEQQLSAAAEDLTEENNEQFWEDELNDVENSNASSSQSNSMTDLFTSYGQALIFNGACGGFASLPSIALGGTLFKLGYEGAAVQYGSIFLLALFYVTQFDIVGYIPKTVFSSLIFVTSMEMIESWLFLSYKKIATKSDFIVIPVIIVCTFLMGSLQSVGVGLIFSTFLFVRTMNKTGVVKYITNGLMIHSTTERNSDDSAWLDQNGDLIQILVLQSYIFFGNANSCLGYVSSMFEDLPENVVKNLTYPLPPLPKYLIIDMTLVSGLEVSSVDIFAEVVQICFRNKCRVMFTGVSPRLRYQFTLVGLKPTSDKTSANSYLRFSNNLEDALCYAEDALLKKMSLLEQKELRNSRIRSNSNADDGFLYALKEIDNQHGLDTLSTLAELRYHVSPIELQAGESLFHYEDGTPKPESERDDLYFIEFGIMKVERDSNQTTTRKSLHMKTCDMRHGGSSNMSLSELQPRTATLGREAYLLKNTGNGRSNMETRSLRLARLKPGSIIGAIGSISQLSNSGEHIACSPMRLWQLKQDDIQKLEGRNPRLILELFRMKAYLAAQRQEMTIHQLATLQQIMTSLAPKKPMNRLTQGAIKIASR